MARDDLDCDCNELDEETELDEENEAGSLLDNPHGELDEFECDHCSGVIYLGDVKCRECDRTIDWPEDLSDVEEAC